MEKEYIYLKYEYLRKPFNGLCYPNYAGEVILKMDAFNSLELSPDKEEKLTLIVDDGIKYVNISDIDFLTKKEMTLKACEMDKKSKSI